MQWEIRDEGGVIHAGTEIEMRTAWKVLTDSTNATEEERADWMCDWEGDLELLQVHGIYR